MLTILFDGIAYGMLLFVLAVGLAVTMGLMNFINLAHGAFAMAGGYITVLLMQRLDVPFLVSLPAAFLGGFNPAISILDIPFLFPSDRAASQKLRAGPFGKALLVWAVLATFAGHRTMARLLFLDTMGAGRVFQTELDIGAGRDRTRPSPARFLRVAGRRRNQGWYHIW